jgi:hypothetical protein
MTISMVVFPLLDGMDLSNRTSTTSFLGSHNVTLVLHNDHMICVQYVGNFLWVPRNYCTNHHVPMQAQLEICKTGDRQQ